MTNPPQDGDERDAGTGGAPADPDQQLTQPVAPYDRSAPPHGAPAQPYGQPPQGQPGYGPAPYGQAAYGPGPHGQQPPGYGPAYGGQPYAPPGSYAPPSGATRPKKSRTRLILGLVALALLVTFAMVLANVMGPTVLNRAAVERDVAEQFEQREGVAVDLTCDEEMRVENGESYTCTGITADGEEVELQITITDENFAEYTWTEP